MSRYRRLFIPGGTYFFTVALQRRGTAALIDEVDLLRDVYRAVCHETPFTTEAIVILPDHLHAVWTLPKGDADFSGRWRRIKAGFSMHCRYRGSPSASMARRGEKGVWQRRFWEHAIRDTTDFIAHVDHCHWNPVKHGLVARPEDWQWSSYGKLMPTRAMAMK